MDQGYDFDIENYNDLELLKFFQLPHNTTNDMIVGKIDTMIQQFGLQRPKNDVEHEFRNFLILSKQRLLKYAESIPPIQLKPTNYDILHSQSALQGANHAVAVEKNIPVINAYEYQFPTGVINPIEKRVITKILNVDSLFRENYDTTNSSNFTWALPNEIKNIVSMNIVSMELPAVWYSVSSKNNSNTFQVKLYNMTDQPSIAHIIELPDGNYSPSEFVVALNNYFINTENGLEFLVAEINPRSMQTVIRARIPTDTPSGPSPYSTEDPRYSPDFYFILEFENYNTNDAQKRTENNLNIIRQYNPMQKMLGWYMGYRNSTYTVRFENTYIDEISSPMGPIEYNGYSISEAAYGSSSQNYIFVEVNDYNKNFITDSIISITNNAYIGNNILGRISLSVTNNTVFNNSSDRIFKLREYLGPVKIKKLNVRLLNKFGDMVDLNNSDFSMSIEFKLLY